MRKIETGDLVSLKSGGPEMTVIAVEGMQVTCQWFDGSKLKSAVLNPAALIISADEEGA